MRTKYGAEKQAEITKRYASGESAAILSKEYGISLETCKLYVLKAGLQWRDLSTIYASRREKSVNPPFNSLYRIYKSRAIKNGVPFLLSKSQFFSLTQNPCYYCGLPPSNVKKYPSGEPFVYSGVDRVVNLEGYTPDNSVSACRRCNQGKNDYHITEFVLWIERLAASNSFDEIKRKIHNRSILSKSEGFTVFNRKFGNPPDGDYRAEIV